MASLPSRSDLVKILILFTVRQKLKPFHTIKDMPRARNARGVCLARTINGIQQQPWKQPRNPYSPFEIASADQIEEIHQASLRILRELGIAFWMMRLWIFLKNTEQKWIVLLKWLSFPLN